MSRRVHRVGNPPSEPHHEMRRSARPRLPPLSRRRGARTPTQWQGARHGTPTPTGVQTGTRRTRRLPAILSHPQLDAAGQPVVDPDPPMATRTAFRPPRSTSANGVHDVPSGAGPAASNHRICSRSSPAFQESASEGSSTLRTKPSPTRTGALMSIAQELAGSACVCVTHRQLDGVKRVPIARCGWPSPADRRYRNAMGRDRQPWEVSGAYGRHTPFTDEGRSGAARCPNARKVGSLGGSGPQGRGRSAYRCRAPQG
jgi:hypothetical protein